MAAEETTKRLREIMLESSGDWPDYKAEEVDVWSHVQPGRELGLVVNVAFADTFDQIERLLDRFSTESLDITLKAIAYNNDNRWVWKFRKTTLESIGHDLREELDLMRSFAKVAKVKCDSMWDHRLHIVKRMGLEAINEEIDFTKNILGHDDPYNKEGWAHLLDLCSLVGYERLRKELDFTEKIVFVDPNFSEPWHYRRYFIGKRPVSDNLYDHKLTEQHLLFRDSENKHAWLHRRLLVLELKIDVFEELNFSKEIIGKDAKNGFAWSQRQWLVKLRDLREPHAVVDHELEFSMDFILYVDVKSYYAWSYRRWLLERRKELFGIYEGPELKLTEDILSEDARNEYAWYHRKWFVKASGRCEYEISFCNKILAEDSHNDLAWGQKVFVITSCAQDMAREEEVSYALRAIVNEPSSECPWIFLRGIYQPENSYDSQITPAIENVLRELHSRAKEGFLDEDIYVNAMTTILDLIYNGYRPSQEFHAMISSLSATLVGLMNGVVHSDNGKSVVSRLVNEISSILQYVDLTDKGGWKWLMERVRYKADYGV